MRENKSMRGIRGIVPAVAAFAFVACVANVRAQAPAAAPLPLTAVSMEGKTAESYYKKIEVLKGVPAAEIHPAMEYITTALGVGCAYCHVIGKFDVDDKREKHVARSMIAMTMALNKTVFDGKREITCYTCHRGLAKAAATLVFPGEKMPTDPVATDIFPALSITNFANLEANMAPSKAPATVVSGPAPAPKPVPVAMIPSAEEVFARYEQAVGGKALIDKLKTVTHKGTVDMLVPAPPVPQGAPPPPPPAMGTVPAEWDVKSPAGMLSVEFPGRPAAMIGYDGKIGWTTTPNREETGDELRLVKETGEKIPALNFLEEHTNVKADATEKIGDRTAVRVVGTRKDGIAALDRVYFDLQSGLLMRTYTTMQSVLGAFPEETTYDDYRDVGGIKIPFQMTVASPEGNRTYKWSVVEANGAVDESKFTKPVPPPPPAPRP